MQTITQLLGQVRDGKTDARDRLFALAYDELHVIARARLRGAHDTALDATSLVHECYLRFVQAGQLRAEDRRAFFAYASQVMRSVILNTVRERQSRRRGGDHQVITLVTHMAGEIDAADEAIVRVHEALLVLDQASPRLAEVAQMRYFGGYSNEEIAEALGVTSKTVERDWAKARLILAKALR